MEALPVDIITTICRYLTKYDIVNLSIANKKIKSLIDSDKSYISDICCVIDTYPKISIKKHNNGSMYYIIEYDGNVHYEYLLEYYSKKNIKPLSFAEYYSSNELEYCSSNELEYYNCDDPLSKLATLQIYDITTICHDYLSIYPEHGIFKYMSTFKLDPSRNSCTLRYKSNIYEAIIFRDEIPISFTMSSYILEIPYTYLTHSKRVIPLGGIVCFNPYAGPLKFEFDTLNLTKPVEFDIVYYTTSLSFKKGTPHIFMSILYNNMHINYNRKLCTYHFSDLYRNDAVHGYGNKTHKFVKIFANPLYKCYH